ncbi:MAG: hypothetical protein LBT49_02040 [Prevotellaceae bacterium]|jgi:hypothetical protein|nr:hypothetical protein [Prevotellaceae bacterium]
MAHHFAQALSTAQLAIIDTGSRAVWRAFKRLCTHRAQTIAYASCRPSSLPEMLDMCAGRGVFAVVLGAAPGNILTVPAPVAVIAPSVSFEIPYMRKLLQNTALTGFSALALQAYLTPAPMMEALNNRYFETLRLGAFRRDPEAAEPLLRDAEYVWFDLSAVRASDAPSTAHPGPNGLYAEEACQLGHYIGVSNRARALFLFGYKSCLWASARMAQLAAQLLWHVAEGAAGRVYENVEPGVAGRPEFKEIVVDMGKQGQALHFLNSLTTGRWWMKIPVAKTAAQWISCLPSDYDTACRGEIPLRWLWHYQKLNY